MQRVAVAQLAAALVGVLVALMPAGAGAQQDQSRLSGSVRLGVEYDDNPLRLQTNDPRLDSDDPSLAFLHDDPDMLARYFASVDSIHRVGQRGRASLKLRHGGKFYVETSQADTLLTQLIAGYRYWLAERVSLNFDADIKDRTERLSRLDYNRGGVRAGLGWAPGEWRLGAYGGWRYFAYKPAPGQGSQGPQFDATVRRFLGESFAAELGYSLSMRDFESERSDAFHVGRVGLSYRDDFFIDATYVLAINDSTDAQQDIVRHGLRLTLTTPLVEKFYGSAKVELQRTDAPDQSRPDALFFVDEENRNVVIVSLARPFGEEWEIEARYSTYLEEFRDVEPGQGSVDLDYSRQTLLLGVGYAFE